MLEVSTTSTSFYSPLQILLVEDDPGQAAFLRETLNDVEQLKLEVTHVTHLSEAKRRLRSSEGFDLVLLDLSLPDSGGLSSLTNLLDTAKNVPVVVLTATDDTALAIEAVRSGAQDYLVKHDIVKYDLDTGPLVRAIRYAVERAEADKALRLANQELEARVEERTKDLVEANRSLAAEIAQREEAQEKFSKAFYANPGSMLIASRAEGRIIDANDAFAKTIGVTREETIGRTTAELHLWDEPEDRQKLLQLLSEQGTVRDFETSGQNRQGELRHGLVSVEQMNLNGEACLLVTIQDITVRKRAEEVLRRSRDELQEEVQARTAELTKVNESLHAEIAQRHRLEQQLVTRVCQQRVVAELGQRALADTDLAALMDEAVIAVARTLEVEYCKVLELLPGGKEVLLRAGVGWKKGYVGKTILNAGPDSQVGHTLTSKEPVVVEDLQSETRFRGLPLLHEHKVVSGISVIIEGRNGPYGVLGAHTKIRSAFNRDDVTFIQAVANVLAQAIERVQVERNLRAARDELEGKVEERTAALSNANNRLLVELAERKRSEEALRESEMRFRFVTQAANVAIWDYNFASGKVWWNEGIKSLFGYSDDEESTDYGWWEERLHPDDKVEVLSSFRAIMEAGQEYWTGQYRFRRADGRYADVIVRGFIVRDQAGAATRMIGSLMDITERKRAEQEHRAREAAEVANQAKNEFLSRMSHELRTPLNAMLGFAQLLELDGLDATQRESVGFILKGGQHLLNLINEVLDISRIESGRLALSVGPMQMSGVLQEALDLIRPLAAQRDIRVNADLSGACEQQVIADSHRVKQVLLNLLANAVKYNREGGSADVFCEEQGGGWMRVSVSDTGNGIPPEKMSRLFTPFERLGAEQSSVEGVGLGLALSKRLVEAMGGSIGVESTVAEGCTFWIDLPVLESDEKGAKKPGAEPPLLTEASEGTYTIVYAEDNLSSLALVKRVIAERPNIRLITAVRGEQALELVREHRPNLVLLDLNLPDMSGEEVLRKLHEEPETHNVPVVMISADASPVRVERLLAAGAQDYLTKPIDVRQFLQVLDDTLETEPQILPSVS